MRDFSYIIPCSKANRTNSTDEDRPSLLNILALWELTARRLMWKCSAICFPSMPSALKPDTGSPRTCRIAFWLLSLR